VEWKERCDGFVGLPLSLSGARRWGLLFNFYWCMLRRKKVEEKHYRHSKA